MSRHPTPTQQNGQIVSQSQPILVGEGPSPLIHHRDGIKFVLKQNSTEFNKSTPGQIW